MSNQLILIIGPSWVWKWTMIEKVKEKYEKLFFPISVTTRKMREWEKEWEVYNFISNKEFKEKIKNNEFLEYACVHDVNYYGTLKEPVLNALNQWKTVLREIDYQWFLSIKKVVPAEKLLSVFFMPPEIEILKKRIKDRAPISEEELNHRIDSIKKEMKVADQCDIKFEQIDWDIEASFKKFEKIIFN